MADKSNGDMKDALDAFLSQVAAERPARPVTPSAAAPPTATPRPVGPPPAAPTGPTPTGSVTPAGKEELLAAFDRLVEHEATKPRTPVVPAPAPWKRYFVPALGAMSAVATAYLWIAQPAWLYPRFEPTPPPGTTTEARLQLLAASFLVEQYQQEAGHFPTSFADLGFEPPTLSTLSITGEAGGGYRIIGGTASQPMFVRGIPGQPLTLENFPR